MTKYLVLILATIGLFACGDQNAKKQTNIPSQDVASTPTFEKLPESILRKMWDEAEMLDYIFHDLPFSMSQNEKPSIQANMTYIDKYAQPNIPIGCKPAARQFYQINGKIELEADIYFSKGCYFYVFLIDGKPKYANKMAQDGINFFNTMISKALNAQKGIG